MRTWIFNINGYLKVKGGQIIEEKIKVAISYV